MVTYNFITNAEIDPESPVTESLMTRLRDNPIAIIEGATGAPRATTKIITPGGSEADGALTDGTTLTLPGFFEYSSGIITVAKSFPWITLMRVNGNFTLSNTLTLKRPTVATQSLLIQTSIVNLFGGLQGDYGTNGGSGVGNDEGDGGGGACAHGGQAQTTTGPQAQGAVQSAAMANTYRPWMKRRPLVGGNAQLTTVGGGTEARGGGCLILLVNGDCDFTGGTIDVSGDVGDVSGNGNGGAGGGSIYVFCNGTIDDGTFLAKGGNGHDAGSGKRGGGGGGGVIGLFAKAFTGAQTRTVTGGTATGPANAGENGYDIGNITLSEAIINSMLLGAAA